MTGTLANDPPSSRSKQVEPLPHGLLSWIPAILRADAKQIIAKNGLDAYVFVRFLWLMVELFFPVYVHANQCRDNPELI